MGNVPYVGFATYRRATVKICLYFKGLIFMYKQVIKELKKKKKTVVTPGMSAADALTKSASSIETQLADNNAVGNDVLPVEDQPAVDINPINMATSTYGNTTTMRLGDTADTCHSSTSNTKGKHPEYPGHN
jgi:hypothetical protein